VIKDVIVKGSLIKVLILDSDVEFAGKFERIVDEICSEKRIREFSKDLELKFVVESVSTMDEAIVAVSRDAHDLYFMDIDFKDEPNVTKGFNLAELLKDKEMIRNKVIFVVDYEKYANKGGNYDALDFIQKPEELLTYEPSSEGAESFRKSVRAGIVKWLNGEPKPKIMESPNIRVLILDDKVEFAENFKALVNEICAEKKMREFSNGIKRNYVVQSVSTMDDAVSAVSRNDYDLYFMDIQFDDAPNITGGFSLAEIIKNKANYNKKVIFITNYKDEYAAKGYKFNAIDFIEKQDGFELFKPGDNVYEAFKAKVRAGILDWKETETMKMNQKRLWVSDDGCDVLILHSSIIYIEREKGRVNCSNSKKYTEFVNIITEKRSYLYKSTMKDLKKQLSKTLFDQINPQVIINNAYLDRMDKKDKKVFMKNGKEFIVTRRSKTAFFRKSK